jgi:hypothetical protein
VAGPLHSSTGVSNPVGARRHVDDDKMTDTHACSTVPSTGAGTSAIVLGLSGMGVPTKGTTCVASPPGPPPPLPQIPRRPGDRGSGCPPAAAAPTSLAPPIMVPWSYHGQRQTSSTLRGTTTRNRPRPVARVVAFIFIVMSFFISFTVCK